MKRTILCKVTFVVIGMSICALAIETAQAESYHYYYFDQKRPLSIDTTRVAILEAIHGQQALAKGRFEKFGIVDADVKPWPIAGWSLADVPARDRSHSGIGALVSRMAVEAATDFVSPVFIGRYGGPIIITPTIFVGVEEGIDSSVAEQIIAESRAGTIIERDYANMKGVYRLQSQSRDGFEVLQAANRLAELQEVRFAEPDRIATLRKSLVPNDPGFAQCWGIHNTGQSGGTSDIDMDGLEAWDIATGDPSIIVVVLDNGVQQDHPDIHQIAGADFTGQGGGGGPVNECDKHGTAVAGCISATINNGLGTVGIAPDCVIASARISVSKIPCDGTGIFQYQWIMDALDWAVADMAP